VPGLHRLGAGSPPPANLRAVLQTSIAAFEVKSAAIRPQSAGRAILRAAAAISPAASSVSQAEESVSPADKSVCTAVKSNLHGFKPLRWPDKSFRQATESICQPAEWICWPEKWSRRQDKCRRRPANHLQHPEKRRGPAVTATRLATDWRIHPEEGQERLAEQDRQADPRQASGAEGCSGTDCRFVPPAIRAPRPAPCESSG